MGYATPSDMQARYPDKDLRELTDEMGATINTDRIAQALADASAEIDSSLMGRYVLPLGEIPPVLTVMCCTIAMYRLQSLRPNASSEDARLRYKDAAAWLSKVATGEAQLGISSVDATTPAQSSGPVVKTATRTFTRDATRGF